MGLNLQSARRVTYFLYKISVRDIVIILTCCAFVSLMVGVILFEVTNYEHTSEDKQEIDTNQALQNSKAPNINESSKISYTDLVGSILSRPLFQPERRPPEPMLAQALALVMPRLTGIVIAPGRTAAIFQSAKSPQPVVLKTGEVLENIWAVVDIAVGKVTLAQGDTMLVLQPHFAADRDLPSPKPTQPWKVGLRRSDRLPSYLQRRG